MSPIPPKLRDHLTAPSLTSLWAAVRKRLEQNGHALRGSVSVQLDDDGADKLSGLLGRPVNGGTARIRLTDLDASLRSSAAACGLVSVVADLTGAPLRNLPAERDAVRADRQVLWAELDQVLAEHGLADEEWAGQWADWLRASGAVTRLPRAKAAVVLRVAVEVLARVLADNRVPIGLAELASEVTGDAHGLDNGYPAAAMVLRGIAYGLQIAPAAAAAERRDLWQRVGVNTDEVSGTVITWALRPPGDDRWSAMMRERADLGLITHLTVHELHRSADLSRPGDVIYACENPQVLQGLAAAGVDRPVACMSGNPAAAGIALLARSTVRYHGDFDWPGIAIARRIFGLGAQPWRFGHADYAAAIERLPADNRLGLTGRAQATPWDEGLSAAMMAADVAVHEEAIMDQLLADLRSRNSSYVSSAPMPAQAPETPGSASPAR
jgi:uncharacterized protein (TIGR02679 family)